MWTTLIPTAIAAAIVASVVNLASEINNLRAAHQGPGIELTLQRDAPALRKTQGSSKLGAQQDKDLDPGA
jgi:hypothetical protein